MPAPTDSNSASRIIELAMEDACLIGEGNLPGSPDYAKYMRRLNEIIKLWQTQGLKLWLQYNLSVPLVAGQRVYRIGPTGNVVMAKPLRVLDSSYYQDSNGNRRPIYLVSQDSYNRFSQITNLGEINSYFVHKLRDYLEVELWNTPDTNAATGILYLLIQQQVSTVLSLTDTMDFPEEWFIALHWGLAAEICSGQPAEVINRCESKAAQFREMLENWDVEDAPTMFEPDQRSFTHYGRFK